MFRTEQTWQRSCTASAVGRQCSLRLLSLYRRPTRLSDRGLGIRRDHICVFCSVCRPCRHMRSGSIPRGCCAMRHRQTPMVLSRCNCAKDQEIFFRLLPMTHLSSRPQVTSAVVDDEKCAPLFPTCPMCHTPTSLTQNAIDAGADWWCVTCGQRWDATRLSAVAAYAAWVVERAAVDRKDGGHAPLSHTAPTE